MEIARWTHEGRGGSGGEARRPPVYGGGKKCGWEKNIGKTLYGGFDDLKQLTTKKNTPTHISWILSSIIDQARATSD